VRAGMKRVKAASSNPQILVTAFRGEDGERTLILLNRSSVAQKVTVKWPGASFKYLETADPRQENSVEPSPVGASLEVPLAPGSIVTLTNVELGKVTGDLEGV
jgi:Glycosyl hydrolase family 30 beta sandwich domain